MYVGRKLAELQNTPIKEWDIKELAYHQQTMHQMEFYLNQEGENTYKMILNEIESRGGLPKSSGAWDHSSEVIFD